jgi:hypothetical protein
MADIRFIRKDGQSVATAIVRKRFFESAVADGVGPERASRIWQHAMFGDPYARQIVEELCEIEIVDSDTGFGFL